MFQRFYERLGFVHKIRYLFKPALVEPPLATLGLLVIPSLFTLWQHVFELCPKQSGSGAFYWQIVNVSEIESMYIFTLEIEPTHRMYYVFDFFLKIYQETNLLL